ncbi:DUF4360 domain-containing protein [Thiolinea disciformis]|uniref:DUF4360 domain-containing protein n=1 Tax=Thiolinea disciformis TaxID=125614 RepID=UPI0003787C97|nr:DUF4360 domain-containing protein [Thiolinea disciformis]
MKTVKTLVAAASLAFVALASQNVSATPNKNAVYFGKPAIAGSGCKAGSTDYALTPDGQTLSILFDSYSASSGNKACNLAIPVHVPSGYQVSLLTADYRGFVQGAGDLRRSYFFAGSTGPSLVTPMTSKAGKEYLQRDNMLSMTKVFSACGKDVNLRINSRIVPKGYKSTISVDSLDLKNGIIFQLKYKKC